MTNQQDAQALMLKLVNTNTKLKLMNVGVWMHIFAHMKDGVAQVPFIELSAHYGISRVQLYRVLSLGEPFNYTFKSANKLITVTYSGEQPEVKPKKAPASKPRKSTKEDSMGNACKLVYEEWYDNRIGMPVKYQVKDHAGMKQIVKYLSSAVVKQYPQIAEDELQLKTINAWKYILAKWDVLTPFYQGQVQLSQINSNLPNILHAIKASKTPKGNNRTSRFAEADKQFGNSESAE